MILRTDGNDGIVMQYDPMELPVLAILCDKFPIQ